MRRSDGRHHADQVLAAESTEATLGSSRRTWWVLSGAVFGLAVAVRLLLVATSSGGFTGDVGYDQSVYFTAADALTHGRLPYGDFLLLHPPGLMLALTPFALLARVTGDHPAFVVANVFFSCVGGLSAALITRIARNWGLPRRGALAGGVFYAVWLSAAGAELGARLEPLGTFAFLGGVLALSKKERPATSSAVLAGIGLGFAATVKIWWIVPLLVRAAWYAGTRRDGRTAWRLVAGAMSSIVLVIGPFFALAPLAMWRMVVADQLGRNTVHTSKLDRLFEMSSLGQLGSPRNGKIVAAVLIVAVGSIIATAAWRRRIARPVIVTAVVQLLVLLISPSYFGYYAGYFAPGAALVIAAAASGSLRRRRRSFERPGALLVTVIVAVAAAISGLAIASKASIDTPTPLAVGDVPRQLRPVRCVVADSPMALIALDSLSRGLAAGCPNWGDVSGRTYDVDANAGHHVARHRNRKWQTDLQAYLLSGQAVVVIRGATGLSDALKSEVDSLPVIARHGRVVVHRVHGHLGA